MRFRRTLFRLSTCMLACGVAAAAAAGNVEVHVSGIKGGKGKINVAVCDKERFLKECAYSASAPAGDGPAVVTFKDVPAGSWAVLAYQDANENDKLDRNPIGVPSERYGFSREARGKFGPPTFDKAAIEVGEAVTVAPVKLR